MQQHLGEALTPSRQPILGATVTVLLSTGGVPTLYASNGAGALASNVLTADGNGEFAFFAANGRYSITIAATGYAPRVYEVLLFDPADASASTVTDVLLVAFDGDLIPLMPKPASVTSEPASLGQSTDWLAPATRRRFVALLDTAAIGSGATSSAMGQAFTVAGEAADEGLRMFDLPDFVTQVSMAAATSGVAVTVQGVPEMAVAYIAPGGGGTPFGSDTDNPLGTASAPRLTPPAQADGMVWRFLRGSTWSRTNQLQITAQGMIICDYGNPQAPRPRFTSIIDAPTSAAFTLTGDTIFANIDFDLVDRTSSQGPSDPVGPHCVSHFRRGGAGAGVQTVSGFYLGCGFRRIGNNCINASPLTNDSFYADAAPVVVVLACDFEDVGNDCIYVSARDYLEVGHCKATGIGNRTDSNPDFVNMIYAANQFAWIHDNFIEHTGYDQKHAIILDNATGQSTGLAIVERNTMLMYGSASPYTQAAFNAGINTDMRTIFRNNYVRGSRLLFVSLSSAPDGIQVYGNLFDYTGSGASNAALIMNSKRCAIHNNTFVSRNRLADSHGLGFTSTATNSVAERNLFVGFNHAISTSGPRSFITGGNNRFASCTNRYWDRTNSLVLDDDPTDAVLSESQLLTEFGIPCKPQPGVLVDTMRALDRRVPDFWGRFAPEGVGYIGALLERGL